MAVKRGLHRNRAAGSRFPIAIFIFVLLLVPLLFFVGRGLYSSGSCSTLSINLLYQFLVKKCLYLCRQMFLCSLGSQISVRFHFGFAIEEIFTLLACNCSLLCFREAERVKNSMSDWYNYWFENQECYFFNYWQHGGARAFWVVKNAHLFQTLQLFFVCLKI